MDLSKASVPFESTYWCHRGFTFKAQLLAGPLQASSMYFFLPRRLLKFRTTELVLPGDHIVSQPAGRHYLCGENADAEMTGSVLYRTLKLFEVTHVAATWERSATQSDAVTGIRKKGTPPLSMGQIPIAIEFTKMQEDEMRIPADMVRIIAKDPILVEDYINSTYKITNVESQLGLYFATAKRQ